LWNWVGGIIYSHCCYGGFGRNDINMHRTKENMDSRNIKSKLHCLETKDSRREGCIGLYMLLS